MELRISTWNCFGMGQGIDALMHLRAPFGHRFKDADVVSECCSPDVLCVQEILSREAQRFFDGLGPSHFVARVRDDNRVRFGDGSVRGTGLGVSARCALERPLIRSFPGERVGWDRLARKGAIYVELKLDDGPPIDLVTVHLQAGYDDAAARVRASQLGHLKNLIDEMGSRDRAFVVCGDFNIDGLEGARGLPEYAALTEALEGFVDLGAADDLPTFHPRPDGNGLAYAFEPDARDQRVDYIFLRPPTGAVRVHCTRLTRFFDRPLAATTFAGEKPAWASDHYGVTATLRIDRG